MAGCRGWHVVGMQVGRSQPTPADAPALQQVRSPHRVRLLEGRQLVFALVAVLGLDPRVQHRRVVGLGHIDLRVWRSLLEQRGDALERTSRAVRAKEIVEIDALRLEGIEDLRSSRGPVNVRVRLIVELVIGGEGSLSSNDRGTNQQSSE